ncbi:MAG: peptidase T [Deltaproteobacteria bacterium]|nr:MAG: peptidase T [Deltaproteobacteria bacterium]PIE74960.1 MAG: peptidase T [Deltaproteobacteria bacterium]
MINESRLKKIFEDLVKIDSPSGEEKEVFKWLKSYLEKLGGKVFEDNASEKVNGNSNNLIAHFNGKRDAAPLFLCAHMDTVEPGRGIEPVFENGEFKSRGKTILGADDKSAIAIILEIMNILREKDFDNCPLDIVFTVCEESGLKGAKAIDESLIRADFGYIPDSTDPFGIVAKAPSCCVIRIKITGKSAHAGAEPEKGINAIMIAARALSCIESGRIDYETTCNIGKLNAGKATNIVPDYAVVEAEVRSHDTEKLDRTVKKIIAAFENAVENEKKKNGDGVFPFIDIEIDEEFPNIDIKEDEKVIALGKQAAYNLGFDLELKEVGGGSDANVFFKKGIKAGVIGTGMKNIHTEDENIALQDMVACARFLYEIIDIHSQGKSGC